MLVINMLITLQAGKEGFSTMFTAIQRLFITVLLQDMGLKQTYTIDKHRQSIANATALCNLPAEIDREKSVPNVV